MAALDGAEVARHSTKKSCWIVLDSKVYDVTSFLGQHPGGAAIILKQAGTDATSEFQRYHSLDYIDDLPRGSLLGPIDPDTLGHLSNKSTERNPATPSAENPSQIPHLSLCVSTSDFEKPAKDVLPHKSYVYISTSANTGHSLQGNLDDWTRITFRPRILRDVGAVDPCRAIFGHTASYPFYISPMGTIGAIHALAEPELVRGAIRKGVHTVISTASTKTAAQIKSSFDAEHARLGGKSPSKLFYQFYMPVDRAKAIALLRIVRECGYASLWITVDTPVLGKRTADRVLQAEEALAVELSAEEDEGEGEGDDGTGRWEAGVENEFAPAMGGRVIAGQLSPHTTWEDLAWCAEDVRRALEFGCQGVLLSNHGGRQLHTAPSALMTLLEIRAYCPEVLGRLDIFLDGGLRDGADVLKALALGATAVGVGRPFLYALAAYGAKGVERCIDVLADELVLGMRLLGITSLEQIRPEMVNAQRLLNEMWRPEGGVVKSRL